MTLNQRKRIVRIIHGCNFFTKEIGNEYVKKEGNILSDISFGPPHFMKMNEYLAYEISNLHDWDQKIIIDNSLENIKIIFGRNDCNFTTTIEIDELIPSTKEEFEILEKLAVESENYEKAAELRDQKIPKMDDLLKALTY